MNIINESDQKYDRLTTIFEEKLKLFLESCDLGNEDDDVRQMRSEIREFLIDIGAKPMALPTDDGANTHVLSEIESSKTGEHIIITREVIKHSRIQFINTLKKAWDQPPMLPLVIEVIKKVGDSKNLELLKDLSQAENDCIKDSEDLKLLLSALHKKLSEVIKLEDGVNNQLIEVPEKAVGLLAKFKETKYFKAIQVIGVVLGLIATAIGITVTVDSFALKHRIKNYVEGLIWGKKKKTPLIMVENKTEAKKQQVRPLVDQPKFDHSKVWPSSKPAIESKHTKDSNDDDTFQ